MRLTEEDMQERRNTVIQVASRLFCERGIKGVSLLEIAQKAHIGEKTIYRYFNNKETLVLETFVMMCDAIMQNVEQIVENVPHYNDLTGYEQMGVWLAGFGHLFQADKEFVLFSYEAKLYLLRHHVTLDPHHQDALIRSFRSPCLAALNKGKADGSITVQMSSEDLFYAIWGAVRGYVVKIVVYEALYGEESPWESRYEVMTRGILSALSSG